MAKKRRKCSAFLSFILLLTPALTDTKQTRKCSLLSTLQRSYVLRHNFYKYCDSPESCKCKGATYPHYCYFGDDCEICLYNGQPKQCKDNNGLTSPPDEAKTCTDQDQFLCKGNCERKTWKKECDGKCISRTDVCETEGNHCNVSHTPNAIDWNCGGRCRNDVTKEKSTYFHCGGVCRDKLTLKECNGVCIKRSKLCAIDGDLCKVSHQNPSTDWKCGDECRKVTDKSGIKECNGKCVHYSYECETEERMSTKDQTNEETSINPQTDAENNKNLENKNTHPNEEGLVCPEGKFACGSQCVNNDLQFVDCDGVCLDKTTLKNGTCPVKQSHTKLIVGLSVGIFFLLSLVSLTYNAVVTCKKYKAIQPVDRNVEFGITEAPSTFCWVIQHIPFYCSDDMRRAVQEQAEMEISSNPDYGMEMDEYNDPEYNGTELVDYNDYYGDSE